MEITLLIVFLSICFIFTLFGIHLKDPTGLLYVLAGSLGFLILGINMMGSGIAQNYILNETLTVTTTEDAWTGFFGLILTSIGIGTMLLVVIEVFSKK